MIKLIKQKISSHMVIIIHLKYQKKTGNLESGKQGSLFLN